MTAKIKITKDLTLYLANLAQLKISPKELKKLKNALQQTLDCISVLEELDTTGIKPLNHIIGLKNITREDEVKNSLLQKDALKGTKSKMNGYFKIKSIF